MSTRLQLRIRAVPNAIPRIAEDEDEGERLVGWVKRALEQKKAPPAAVILRPERSEILPLAPALKARIPVPRFFGALSRSTVDDAGLPYAVSLIGAVQLRQRPRPNQQPPPPIPMAVVFVEWPDNRWWHWRALLEPDGGGIREGTEAVTRAVDGDAMPRGLGRWFALGRRANLQLHLNRSVPETGGMPIQDGGSMVH